MGRLAERARTADADEDLTEDVDGEQDADEIDEFDDHVGYDEVAVPPRTLGWILTIGGLLAFGAAFTLMVEDLQLLKDSSYMPTCSIDAVLQCSSVMSSDQAAVFGFPNPLIGVVAFPIVLLAGVLALSRVSLPPWFWRWTLAGTTYGIAFIGWLISQSLYEIRALCPYCMVVWACMIPIFWRTLGWTLSSGQFGESVADSALARVLERFWWVYTLVTYAVVLTLVLTAFPYYFF